MDEITQGAKPISPPLGMYELKLDDRQRLKLPAVWVNFFNSLNEKILFVTSLDDRIARIYPMSVWLANQELLDAYIEDPDAAEAVTFTAQDNGTTVEMDAQGRITFPTKLREKLKIEGQELHLYGYRGHAEVMTDEVYRETLGATAAAKQQAALKLKRAGLK
jgi:transcriptional regulator MraZ